MWGPSEFTATGTLQDYNREDVLPNLDLPVLFHTCKALQQCGVDEIIINCHHLGAQIVEAVASHPHIIASIESSELGTGGGLRHALPLLGDDPVLVINGDIYHTIDLPALCHHHQCSGADATLVLHDYPRFNKVSVAASGAIKAFHPLAYSDRVLAFTGIQIIHPSLLYEIPANIFYNVIDCYDQAIAAGKKIMGHFASGHFWADMGTPEDYLQLHGKLLTEARFAAGSPFFFGHDVRCDTDQFNDWVCVGSRATIGKDACLKRVIVWDGATVQPGAQLQDVIVT